AGGVAFAASASACLRARMAFGASPGLEARERSMPRAVFAAVEALVAAPLGFLPEVRNSRTFEASSASIELEWVFGSVTPTAVRASRISLLFTSSSRARSLIRTLLIRLFSLPLLLAAHISLFEKGFLCFPFIIPGNRSRANRGMRFRLIFRGCPIQGFAWAGITRPHALFAFRLLIRALRCEVFALVDQRIDRVVFQLDLLLARVGIAQRIRVGAFIFSSLDVLGRNSADLFGPLRSAAELGCQYLFRCLLHGARLLVGFERFFRVRGRRDYRRPLLALLVLSEVVAHRDGDLFQRILADPRNLLQLLGRHVC